MKSVDHDGEERAGTGSVTLPAFLRAWRAAAGAKLGRGRPLSQKETAERMEVSERWYRSLESGDPVPLPGERLGRLASALLLGPDEQMALYAHALGGALQPPPAGAGQALDMVAHLAETLGPYPVYLADRAWNVISHNARAAEWFPWISEPSANLLRWALTTAEGREQLVDWRENAEMYLAQLKFTLLSGSGDADLQSLLDEILAVPECRHIWEQHTQIVAYRHGHRFRIRLPWISPVDITVTAQVLLPAYIAYGYGVRCVVLMPESETGTSEDRAVNPRTGTHIT